MLRLPPALARGVGAPRAGGWGQRLVQERWDNGTMGEGSSWTSCSRKLPGVGFGVFSPPKTSFLVFGVGFFFFLPHGLEQEDVAVLPRTVQCLSGNPCLLPGGFRGTMERGPRSARHRLSCKSCSASDANLSV